MNYFLYRHIRPDTDKVFYVGIGKHNPKWKYKRALTHSDRNIHWKRIVNINQNVFISEIILDNLTQDEVLKKEPEFINIYGRSDLKEGSLCNLTNGGEGVVELSVESRQKISQAMSGIKNHRFGVKQSAEVIAKRSSQMIGDKNPNYGKSQSLKNKMMSSITHRNKKHSLERIEHRAAQLRKRISNTDTGFIYNSISDAAIDFQKSPAQMTRNINNNKYPLKFI